MVLISVLFLFFILALIAYIYYYFNIYPAQTSANTEISEVPLCYGMIKVVYWEENEAILIGKKKKVIYDSTKNLEENERIIFPFKGEEVLARVNIGSELLAWKDNDKTATKDGLRVQIDVTLRWSIENLKDYLYKINRPKGNAKSHQHLRETTLVWLSKHLEATMRRLVRDLTIGELISSSSSNLFPADHTNTRPKDIENISQKVEQNLKNDLSAFGILVEKIDISDIQFEPQIQRAIDKVKEAILEEQRSSHEGEAALNRLKPLIRELGKDGVILIEALKNGGFLFPPQQLTELLDQTKPKKQVQPPTNEYNSLLDNNNSNTA